MLFYFFWLDSEQMRIYKKNLWARVHISNKFSKKKMHCSPSTKSSKIFVFEFFPKHMDWIFFQSTLFLMVKFSLEKASWREKFSQSIFWICWKISPSLLKYYEIGKIPNLEIKKNYEWANLEARFFLSQNHLQRELSVSGKLYDFHVFFAT